MRVKSNQLWAGISDFLEGAFKIPASSVIRKEAFDLNDSFLLLLFGDFLGIPNPVSYYTLELLPYLADELEGWERRILGRKSIIAEKVGQYDFCC
ncbi:MAG: hypothetical protein ACE5WD_12535 [Candidatus Aminicenantia bacterium]